VRFRWQDGGAEDVEIVDYHEETCMIDDTEMAAMLPPMHPGKVLREEFIEPLDPRPARSQKPARRAMHPQ
jgi:hypothetical protein